ncbi:N-terminal domain of NEFA-interacting nuclear protein NIP30-domain-containing protein [Chytriomyces sp. MP71]|nr:N-terminal domain of NEFA-interacting nuclear protein NIP30-domain-containing protein [Chytriomyces sp. MP71]
MNRFVSKGAVQGEAEIVDPNADNSAPAPDVYVPPDNRTLYERLQTNKLKKEEEFAEKTRLANLIKKLDPDEIEFLSAQHDAKRAQQKAADSEVKAELAQFRRAAEQNNAANEDGVNEDVRAEEERTREKARAMASFSASLKKRTKPTPREDGIALLVAGCGPSKKKRVDTDEGTGEAGSKRTKAEPLVASKPSSEKDLKPASSSTVIVPKPALGLVSGYGSDDEDEDKED